MYGGYQVLMLDEKKISRWPICPHIGPDCLVIISLYFAKTSSMALHACGIIWHCLENCFCFWLVKVLTFYLRWYYSLNIHTLMGKCMMYSWAAAIANRLLNKVQVRVIYRAALWYYLNNVYFILYSVLQMFCSPSFSEYVKNYCYKYHF